MNDEEILDKLARELERALDGLSPLEKALELAKGFSEVYGGRWSIEAKADGGFTIKKDAGG